MTIPFSEQKKRWMRDPEFRQAYESLEEEFDLARMLIRARMAAGLTQEELARRMGTSQSAIARMEAGHTPSLKTLQKFARATGHRLKITLEAMEEPQESACAG